MKKAGKIIASIFASICIVVSLITVGVGFAGEMANKDPDALKDAMQQSQTEMTEAEKEATKAVGDFMMNIDHERMIPQGAVGALLSIVILVTVLINVPKIPIITPAIASVAALGGAIYCGMVIMIFMVVALIGCVLVLVANFQESTTSS